MSNFLRNQEAILVTGGAGFIGSCLISELNKRGYNNIVICDDLKETEKWKNLVGKRFLALVSKTEIFEWLKKEGTRVTGIVHLGACSSTTERNGDYLLKNNTEFSIRLASFAIENGIRFVYASSAATYGDGALGFNDNDQDIVHLRPLNLYGFSKQLFDLWALDQGVLNKIAGLKYFNVFGPNEYHKGRMCSAVFHMTPKAEKGEPIVLFKSNDPSYKDGEQMRDFIYVKDAVRITLAFLNNQEGGLFNVGTGIPHSWNELSLAIFKALNKKPHIEYMEMPADLKGKYQNFTAADTQKLQKAIGKEFFFTSLEDSVGDYVKNYLLEGKYL